MSDSKEVVEWYRKWRPARFKDVVGQDEAIALLQTMLETDSVPHALLFSGNSGSGKTTLARILRDKMAVSDRDFFEVNCADFRGIDTVREIIRQTKTAAWSGTIKMWLVDECFPSNTPVLCPSGNRNISSIKKGDKIYNINGVSEVEDVFVNHVSLDRIVRLQFDDGTVIFTTKDHKFLTEDGWRKSSEIGFKVGILGISGYNVDAPMSNGAGNGIVLRYLPQKVLPVKNKSDNVFQSVRVQKKSRTLRKGLVVRWKEEKGTENQRLFGLWQVLHSVKTVARMLFQKLFSKSTIIEDWSRENRSENLSRMRTSIHNSEVFTKNILWSFLSRQKQNEEIGDPREIVFRRGSKKTIDNLEEISGNTCRIRVAEEAFGEDDQLQSVAKTWDYREDNGYQKSKRNCQCLVRRSRRQWGNDTTTGCCLADVRRRLGWLEARNDDCNRFSSEEGRERHSVWIQSRYRKSTSQNSNRDRWERAQDEKSYIEGRKKDQMPRRVRLVSIESYQQGSNDSTFADVVKAEDRNRGFVEFYDLQIADHPSYFVYGLPVHNCHRSTADFQEAMLKLLEDTPSHVYFVLATTDPDKLKDTLRTRCTEIKFRSLGLTELRKSVELVLVKEKVKLPDSVIDKAIETAGGSARKALVTLQQVSLLPTEEEQLAAIEPPGLEKGVRDLATALLYEKPSWASVSKILTALGKEDPERVRHYMLAWVRNEMLKNGKSAPRAYRIFQEFRDPWYECKEAGLVAACFAIVNNL